MKKNFDAYCLFHVLALKPDSNNSYILYYLHLLTHPNDDLPTLCPASPPAPSVSFSAKAGCYTDSKGNPITPTTLPLLAGTHVKAGCEIAKSGDAGAPGAPHLHFEIQQILPIGGSVQLCRRLMD